MRWATCRWMNGRHHLLSVGECPVRTRQHHSDLEQKLRRLGHDLRRSDHCDSDFGSAAASFDNDQHSRGELSFERPQEGWVIPTAGGRSGPASPLSLPRNLAERSSLSRLHFVAQNQRGLDCSGPFYEHCSIMRERGLRQSCFSGASRWSASESFPGGGNFNRRCEEISTGVDTLDTYSLGV